MSDHRNVPGAPASTAAPASAAGVPVPVPAHEPPYYAVVFTSLRTEADHGYAETAERMEELVGEIPGYLGMDHARTPGGLSITVGYFRDAAALEAWRTDQEHRTAQKRGRAEWYQAYTVHVARVERSHTFERPYPADPERG
ncbi:antibiotic biosynthesis monooxygenase family protein [Streptomyces glomeratus]|uniref:ABM domain-containing protein n=1 Tax=Streptomyces glomeratus TaxID=284452 RepID=A0ABP6LJ14_9ACTN|nr:antibiotic biosynthesis monooxygenase [Streptomyces glomeratus]MCF1509377.1 antibiotic biosynthesis monooxygenase [Streptomyces glomeratus]